MTSWGRFIRSRCRPRFLFRGDDATRGWLWKYQKYDWKGRVVRTINTDGVDSPTLNDSDTLISYEGCGCAGGQVTTIQGELVPKEDGTGNARRTQKIYEDILGRQFKAETYEWDASTVYTTSVNRFNGMDQVLQSRQYAGTTSSTTYQDTTASFDGFGRMASLHKPEQMLENGDPASSTYSYNSDGSINTTTDARGSTTSYTYNSIGRLTQKTSTLPVNTTTNSNSASSVTNAKPIGWLGNITNNNGTWKIDGWSLDPDTPNQNINVHFYIDGGPGQGTYIGQATADIPRPDVNTVTGYPGDHGYEFTIPSQYIDGNMHWIYVYGIDSANGENPLLEGAPRWILPSPYWEPPALNVSISYTYDNLGNRTSMTDPLGDMQYEYNSLGQMTGETRHFNSAMPNAPLPNNGFKIGYQYSNSGQLKSVTDPFGQEIDYNLDKTGRLEEISGSTFAGVTQYSNNAKYRAWGALKETNYADGMTIEMDYDNNLRASGLNLTKANSSSVIHKNYSYYSDGKTKYTQDVLNAVFDRLNLYNAQGKVTQAKSGAEARGQIISTFEDQETGLPYQQSYSYDRFEHTSEVTSLNWGQSSWGGQDFHQTYSYVNNRIQNPSWVFDADGRVIKSVDENNLASYHTVDATGKTVQSQSENHYDSRTSFDGNGNEIKNQSTSLDLNSEAWTTRPTKYYIRSTVLGKVISEIWANGKKHRSYIRGVGNQTAVQTAYASETAQLNETLVFEYSDVMKTTYRTTDKVGAEVATGNGGEGSPIETDPVGGSVGISTPFIQLTIPYQPETDHGDLQQFYMQDNPHIDMSSMYAAFGSHMVDLPGFGTRWGSFADVGMRLYEESVWNATHGLGFEPNEYYGGAPGQRFLGFGLKYTLSDGTPVQYGGDWSYEKASGRAEILSDIWWNWGDVNSDDCINKVFRYWFSAYKTANANDSSLKYRGATAISYILNYAFKYGFDEAQSAYAVATGIIETKGFMTDYEEAPKSSDAVAYFSKQYNGVNGNIKGTNDGYTFRGTGYANLTGRANFGQVATWLENAGFQSHDLINHPELMLNPDIGAATLILGLKNGFVSSNQTLGKYVTNASQDWANARNTVNTQLLGAEDVAKHAKAIYPILSSCSKSN